MSPTIRLGISTCPNDTFAFHAMLHRMVDWRGLDFQIELRDIQQLNSRAFQGELDIAKVSFHAALLLADRMLVYRVALLWDSVSDRYCCQRETTIVRLP